MHARVPALSSLAALQAAFTLVFVSLTLSPNVVLAQTPVNGQIYTNGLSIINAPALNSEHNVGGNIPVSIEVSGNGKLPFEALNPGSRLDTAYEELNIFLVSSQTNTNLTVSSGPSLLTDEDGTVRHLNYEIPTCIQAGLYNMTFYERSTLDKTSLYVITPIPIRINNPRPSGERCSEGMNELQDQPQADVRAPQSPFLPANSAGSPPLTVTLTGGRQLPTPPASTDPSVTTVTMVVESPVTTTVNGNTATVTTTFTTTAAMRSQDLGGFLPVTNVKNGSSRILGGRGPLPICAAVLVASLVFYL
ncbi:hypothetical protein FA13DRAFT_1725213 [Coprinellus micaceus]|uniref:Uncharacterized protein n=1 Tax=Coprinellus micaceus TaxID=71717 RepID=A0A4Y7TYJ3_COPMI|nr:hypothetical protein FA13DRAFT_1725213 [Coprinellus micaceus]